MPSFRMSADNYKKWGHNFLKFVAPTLAVFFAQLAVGVNWKPAVLVALLALYQSLSDYFGKMSKN